MALPDKHQLKFNIHKDAKTLLEAIKKSLKIYEAEVESSSSASTSTQNIAFVSSQNTDNTNEPVSVVASVYAASAKNPVSALPNVDTLSNAIIYSFFASQSNSPQRTGRNIRANRPTSMGFDMSKVECYNCHMKGHFARKYRFPKDKRMNVAATMTGVFRQKRNQPTMPSWHSPLLVLLVLTIRPRPAKTVVTKPHSPPRKNINCSPSPKASTFPPKVTAVKAHIVNAVKGVQGNWGNPQHALKDKGVIDSRCSRHMTGNMSYLSDFEEINGGYFAFGGNPKGGKLSGKGKIRTEKLDFDDVYFLKELKFNLFSVSQMRDKKNNVLFTDTKYIVLFHEFKLHDENHVLLRVPRENTMYNVDLKNIVPSGDLTCLFAMATLDESKLWHRRMGHINFKTMNTLIYVDDIIFGSTNKDLCKDFEKLMKEKFQMSSMGKLTFFLDGKSASTPIETKKPLLKDPDVTPKASHIHTVKRIFRYLKGKLHLGLWYPKDSPFNLVAYSDSDYAGASLDMKSTTEGCPFFGCRLISWQCKKQIVVATSSTKAEYVAAASYHSQVLWIQNQCLIIDASEGFDQIIDFLNASLIKYALTINPNIYVSCIKQFWSSVSMKTINDVTRLQALVDKKKVINIEATIREALRLDDAESIDCLPNEEIFTELSRMGYEKPSTKLTFYVAFFSPQWKFFIHTILQCMSAKRTSWNEFCSFMASAVICLSTDTPLFEGMIVAQQADDVGAEVAADADVDVVPAAVEPSIPSPTPTTQPPPPPSQELPSTY
nr:putative ribonuclease H-like domain-containing protein [Tanacetum cinerariifolium]